MRRGYPAPPPPLWFQQLSLLRAPYMFRAANREKKEDACQSFYHSSSMPNPCLNVQQSDSPADKWRLIRVSVLQHRIKETNTSFKVTRNSIFRHMSLHTWHFYVDRHSRSHKTAQFTSTSVQAHKYESQSNRKCNIANCNIQTKKMQLFKRKFGGREPECCRV